MNLKPWRTAASLIAFVCVLSLLPQAAAWAHLGGDEGSVLADRDSFKGQLRSVPMLQYQVHEITLGANSVVHEYATRTGTVFAVTWQGMAPPDLRQLFGAYFDEYQSAIAAQTRPGMHRHVEIVQPDLVVVSSGRLRAFRGRAFAPALVPSGVNPAELP